MGILRILAYIAAAIFIFFGILFIWGAFSPQGTNGWIIVGVIGIIAGFGLIWLGGRAGRKEKETTEIIQKIELSGNVDLDKLQCQHCGGAITSKNIEVVAGAPMVKCPYCGSSYQISESPKW